MTRHARRLRYRLVLQVCRFVADSYAHSSPTLLATRSLGRREQDLYADGRFHRPSSAPLDLRQNVLDRRAEVDVEPLAARDLETAIVEPQ